MDKRQVIQEESCRLSKIHSNLILEHATGLGKTRSLLKCIEASTSVKEWLILVPEITLIQNFKDDVTKHGFTHLFQGKIADVICYQSLYKFKDLEYNLAFDEGHHISELRQEYIESIKSDQRILLSATIPRDVRERLEEFGKWYTYKISLQDGIDQGILPAPEIFVRYVELDDKEKIYSWKYGEKVVPLSAKQYYSALDKSVGYWKERYTREDKLYLKKKWFMAAIDRKRWMGEYKTKEAQELLDKSKGRLICFCSSMDQAKRLGGVQSVHSKNTPQQNKAIITNFNNLESERLFSCSMLKEGVNLSSIEEGIIIQLPGNTKEVVQSIGRVLRGLAPKIYILVIKNTKDEDYLDNALKLFNKQATII